MTMTKTRTGIEIGNGTETGSRIVTAYPKSASDGLTCFKSTPNGRAYSKSASTESLFSICPDGEPVFLNNILG